MPDQGSLLPPPVTAAATLITIPLSHYCEKARWALDRVALPYREEPHAPLLHRLATQRNDGGTVPVLVHGSSRFSDSTDILVRMPSAAATFCSRETPSCDARLTCSKSDSTPSLAHMCGDDIVRGRQREDDMCG
jgi:hypothetical protein